MSKILFSLQKYAKMRFGTVAKQPMLAHQSKLPQLPVPGLRPTLQRYVASLEPILAADELRNTRALVARFIESGEGERLHNLLVKRAAQTSNWLSDWWLQSCYMEYRMPVVIYSSPGILLPSQDFPTEGAQLAYASKLIKSALQFKYLIDSCQLEPEKAGSDYLDMSQYQNIFGTCRVPDTPSDRLKYGKVGGANYIVVAHNNNYFKLDVINPDGQTVPLSEIGSRLSSIVEQSRTRAIPIGLLTTQHRQKWAESYGRLKEDNRESIDAIQNSVFLLCLDQPGALKREPNYETHAGHQLLHGDLINSGNRWFDKTIQFIISRDGVVGMTYEHSPSEGPPIANLMDYIQSHIPAINSDESLIKSDESSITKLAFVTGPETLTDIAHSEKQLNILIRDLDLINFKFPLYGSQFIKKHRHSPDSYIQMAIQLAFYKLHNGIAPTYESATLRKFIQGRTETIRSVSSESKLFCESMTSPSNPPTTQLEALKSAIDSHKAYVTAAVGGQGVDRYLLGLRKVASESGLEAPSICNDIGYSKSTYFKLSTSQVAVKADSLMCYAPAVTDGYGCCYNPRSDYINFGVSAFNSDPATSAAGFKRALEESLTQMHDLLMRNQISKL